MAYDESIIRDFLASDLEIIEPGLRFIDKEYHLPNSVGSKGYIDILARDKHGLTVVIELKRSNGAARQCIHELFKYAGLLGKNDGIRLDQLRCIAVSTEWHELLLPFSELYHSGSFQLSGYRLAVDDDGRPVAANRVEPIPAGSGMEICPEHTIVLYEDSQRRSRGIERLRLNLSTMGIENYILAELDHDQVDSRTVYPFGIFFALPVMDFVEKASLHRRIQDEYDEDCEYPIEMAISVAVQDNLDFDDIEISYPDKFIHILSEGTWQIGSWFNSGALKIGPVRTAEVVLAEVAGFDTGQGTSFYKTVSPENHIAWARFKHNVELHVHWCGGWKTALTEFLNRVEGESSVSVSIYAPDDLLSVLHKVLIEDESAYQPFMEVIVSNEVEITDVLVGFLGWDGRAVDGSLRDFIRDTHTSFEGYRWTQHFGGQREFERITCEFFNLEYVTFALSDQQASPVAPLDVSTYAKVNARTLQELQEVFAGFPVTSL